MTGTASADVGPCSTAVSLDATAAPWPDGIYAVTIGAAGQYESATTVIAASNLRGPVQMALIFAHGVAIHRRGASFC